MTDSTGLVDRYLQVWNEQDAETRKKLVNDLFAADVSYTDPLAATSTAGELHALVGAVQAQFPGMRFQLLGDVDAHHAQARFRWALAPADADPVVIGFDVVTVNEDGLITTVLGFLDRAPGLNDEVEPARTYAVAQLRDVQMGEGIVGYLNGIDATLRPFGGKFIIHGGRPTVLEGEWTGDLIVLEFPDRASAEGWYRSDAYQRILPLRTDNAAGTAFLIDGVDDAHAATDILG